MYLSCIFAGKRQKGHPCAFSPHLAKSGLDVFTVFGGIG